MNTRLNALERQVADLKRDLNIQNQKLTDQARLLLSIGKKVMKMADSIRQREVSRPEELVKTPS